MGANWGGFMKWDPNCFVRHVTRLPLDLSPPRFRSFIHPMIIPNGGPRSHPRRESRLSRPSGHTADPFPAIGAAIVHPADLGLSNPQPAFVSRRNNLVCTCKPSSSACRPRRLCHFLTQARRSHYFQERVLLGYGHIGPTVRFPCQTWLSHYLSAL